MHAGPVFLAPHDGPTGFVIMTAPGSSTPSRLIIGATHLDAVLILERAHRLGIEPDCNPARITPVTTAEYYRRTGRHMHPVSMQTEEQRRRITGRTRTAA